MPYSLAKENDWFLTVFINPFPNDKFLGLQTTISNLIKMAESSQNDYENLSEKEELLGTSNFSFSRTVFKRLVLQTRINQGLFGKGHV